MSRGPHADENEGAAFFLPERSLVAAIFDSIRFGTLNIYFGRPRASVETVCDTVRNLEYLLRKTSRFGRNRFATAAAKQLSDPAERSILHRKRKFNQHTAVCLPGMSIAH